MLPARCSVIAQSPAETLPEVLVAPFVSPIVPRPKPIFLNVKERLRFNTPSQPLNHIDTHFQFEIINTPK